MAFTLTMLPALDGDCLVLSWGSSSRPHHLVVDLGRGSTWELLRSHLAAFPSIELLVISHIDADHIAGAMPMVRETPPPFSPRRVWYNGRSQLVATQNRTPIHEPLSARQGEKLSKGIVRFGWPWNSDFGSEVVSQDSAEAQTPILLEGGLSLQLLSPDDAGLVRLLPSWDKEIGAAGLDLSDPDPGEDPVAQSDEYESFGGDVDVNKLAAIRYHPDDSLPNGSSIGFIAEYEGKRALLAADAHSETLEKAIEPLARVEGGRYRLDLAKLSHHGSRENTSPAIPSLIDCTRFAISTNGSRRHKHPHPETVARLLKADPDRYKTFYFNYRQPQTELWARQRLMNRWNYACKFPVERQDDPENGKLVIEI